MQLVKDWSKRPQRLNGAPAAPSPGLRAQAYPQALWIRKEIFRSTDSYANFVNES